MSKWRKLDGFVIREGTIVGHKQDSSDPDDNCGLTHIWVCFWSHEVLQLKKMPAVKFTWDISER